MQSLHQTLLSVFVKSHLVIGLQPSLSCLKPFSSDMQTPLFPDIILLGCCCFEMLADSLSFFLLLSLEVSVFSSHCLIISVYFGGYQGSQTSPGSSEVSPCTHT